MKEHVGVPVVSNGNVRTWEDVCENKRTTSTDGVMVGETLLAEQTPGTSVFSHNLCVLCECG